MNTSSLYGPHAEYLFAKLYVISNCVGSGGFKLLAHTSDELSVLHGACGNRALSVVGGSSSGM